MTRLANQPRAPRVLPDGTHVLKAPCVWANAFTLLAELRAGREQAGFCEVGGAQRFFTMQQTDQLQAALAKQLAGEWGE
jgi:hypothetical protein